MKIAIVDDEKKYLEEMSALVQEFSRRNQCGMEAVPFDSGEAFLDAFSKENYKVVFMDVYLKGMDGIAAASRMRAANAGSILVFLTSSADFMPEAFSCHAFEYITKPFSRERVLSVLWDILKVLPPQPKYIKVTANRKTVPLHVGNIASAMSDAHYLDITCTDGTELRSRMTLQEFLEQIGEDARFVTINKGIAVNAECITEFRDNCCHLENGSRFPIRIRDRSRIEETVRNYHFEAIRQRQAHSAGHASRPPIPPDEYDIPL